MWGGGEGGEEMSKRNWDFSECGVCCTWGSGEGGRGDMCSIEKKSKPLRKTNESSLCNCFLKKKTRVYSTACV